MGISIQATCDRGCGATATVESSDVAPDGWEQYSQDMILCADCFAALNRWLDGEEFVDEPTLPTRQELGVQCRALEAQLDKRMIDAARAELPNTIRKRECDGQWGRLNLTVYLDVLTGMATKPG